MADHRVYNTYKVDNLGFRDLSAESKLLFDSKFAQVPEPKINS